MRSIPKTCDCCGAAFKAGSDLAKWCSSRCSMRAYQRRRRGVPEADPGVCRVIRPVRAIQPELLSDPDELPPAWRDANPAPTAAALAPFAFEGRQLRVSTDEHGNPWFIAADVCAVLGIATEQTRRLDDDEKGLRSMQTLGGTQSMTTVNEFGLYSLILGSRKPDAKRFKRWVTHEVLPAIRKTGRYEAPRPEPQLPKLPPSGPAILIRAKTQREAAQIWCDTLALAAAGAIRRRYSTLHRGPDVNSLPCSSEWQHLPS